MRTVDRLNGKEGADGSSPSEGLPGTKTMPQKAAFSVAAMETAAQLLHKEGVDTRREPDQPARPGQDSGWHQ